MVFDNKTNGEESPWDELKVEIGEDLDQTQLKLKEINLMLDHSKIEVSKLTQKNARVNTSLQQIQTQFDSLPRQDIRQAYDKAIYAQQRLFVMRGQLEKLQSDKNHLDKYLKLILRFNELMDSDLPKSKKSVHKDTFNTVEAMIQGQEAERHRLSRQMHDGPAQALSNFILQTEIAMRLFDIDQDKAREELSSLKQTATSTFQQVRDFIFELRPMMLDDLGLVPTLKRYIDAFNEQSGIDTRLSVTGIEMRMESFIEVMLFRSVQELLNNAIRHSQANQVNVQMDITDTNVRVSIEDTGVGFVVSDALEGSGVGLKVIKDRVKMLNGFFEIDSVIGQGTRVTFQIPAGMSTQSVFA